MDVAPAAGLLRGQVLAVLAWACAGAALVLAAAMAAMSVAAREVFLAPDIPSLIGYAVMGGVLLAAGPAI